MRWLALRAATVLSFVLLTGLSLVSTANAVYLHGYEGSFVVGQPDDLRILLTMAVDNSSGASAGDIYVGDISSSSEKSSVTKFDDSGNRLLELDGSQTPAGSFGLISFEDSRDSGIAVDGSAGPNAGDVYVADANTNVINRFDEAGDYVCQITGTGTPSASECNGPAGSQTPAGSMLPAGLAVSKATGTLYVADAKSNSILEFSSGGAYLGQKSDPSITAPNSLAVDSTGALYVINAGSLFQGIPTNLVKLDPSGIFAYVLDEDNPIRVAVEHGTDEVYVGEHLEAGKVSQFSSAGNKVFEFAADKEPLVPVVAVDDASGRVYVTSTTIFGAEASKVHVYGRGASVPIVTTEDPVGVGDATATFRGTIDPDGAGDVESCRFEYVADSEFGGSSPDPYAAGPPPVPCVEVTPYAGVSTVTASATGLAPSTTYHVRVAAANANDVFAFGADKTFNTTGPPRIHEQSTSDIERFSTVLRAKINPHGYDTEFRFEYVEDEHFDSEGGFASPATKSTALSGIGEGLKPISVSQSIGSLRVGTTYHFRAVAVNSRGTVKGPDQTFTTTPVAIIDRQWAYARLRGASLEAEIDPIGLDTSCRVEYVAHDSFQQSGYANAASEPCVMSAGSGFGEAMGRAELRDLESDTDYHFRFIASNSSGSLVGADETFSTFGIEEFSYEVVDENGDAYSQAGGHPYMSITHYDYNHTLVPSRSGMTGSLTGFIKDVLTELPPGRVAGTVVPPRCLGFVADEERCSGDAQVGTITVEYFDGGSRETRTRGLFNVFPPEGTVSRYSSIDPYVASESFIRSEGDYGATAGAFDITEQARIVGVTAKIWGVPSDPSHNPERRCPPGVDPCVSNAPSLPLLRNPTFCNGDPLTTRARVSTWEDPSRYVEVASQTPPITGCDQLEFNPTIEAQPTVNSADSPTGLDVTIHVPQNQDPSKLDSPDLRNAAFKLPPGLVINPAVANGLTGCSLQQVELNGRKPANCPDASQVGSVKINTPLLDHPIHGGIYVATPKDNPFDSLFAIYIAVADPETGVVIKLAGRIDVDPETGRLTTTLHDNPQLPFEDFELSFFGGPQGLLRTPPTCGAYTIKATLTPWSAPHTGPPAEPTDSHQITSGANGEPCLSMPADAPNRPAFRAGTMTPMAGAYSPFALHLKREDGTQEIADLALTPPPGLLGRIAARGSCSDAALEAAAERTGREEATAPSCAMQSLVGSVDIGAGSGSAPVPVDGDAYLAGPYKGAPLSLAVIVPILAGPYDLGTAVVRAALFVDLQTGQVRIESDPLPTMREGIPLDVRSIAVTLDQPEFTLNPTNCTPMATQGRVTSVFNEIALLSDPFEVGGCRQLGFAPRLRLRLLGKTHRGSHPKLHAVLDMSSRGANVSRVTVTLPPSQFLDNEHIRNICTREQYAVGSCPANSVYGYAKAWTPLLDAPLEGPVYLRSSTSRLPDLLADLNGQVHFNLSGRIDSARGRIRASVAGIPDAPVAKFVLVMKGGGKGLLQNGDGICERPQRASVVFEGHNGKVVTRRVPLKPQCGRRAQHSRR